MGTPNSKPEKEKKSKKSKKNEDRKTSPSSPPRILSKPIPASTTPPLNSSPFQSPITIHELNASPSNGRRMVVAKPCTSENTERSMMVASSVSLNTSNTSVVSGLLHAKSTTYLPGSGNYQTMTKQDGRRTALSSLSSLGPHSFSLSPVPIQSSEPSIFIPHSSSGSQTLRREEFKNEDDDEIEQPLEEPSDAAAITNGTEDMNEEQVNTAEPAAVPLCTEPIEQEAPEPNAPIFSYKEKEEEEFTIIDVPVILPVEVKEGDNEYLEITIIHKD